MAAPADGGDLNELLASMDQSDEDAAPMADDGTLPELTESEVFRVCDADIAVQLHGDAFTICFHCHIHLHAHLNAVSCLVTSVGISVMNGRMVLPFTALMNSQTALT